MVIEFSAGKIIVTQFEIVVRITGEHHIAMQAQTDAVSLIGRGANVIAVQGAESTWSIKLDDEHQLKAVADALGVGIG